MEEKNFKKAVTIFIDILGTHDRQEFNEWYKITDIFYNTVKREKMLDDAHGHTIYKREIHLFSDCAYIIYDYKENVEEEKKDMNALMTIACYNTEKVLYEFLKNGFIARGALTYGDIYYEAERNLFFGPAMNIAYDLESKKAKYPRVIIDPKYADRLAKYNDENYRDCDYKRQVNGEIIKKDEDGFYYINYLNTMSLGGYQIEDEDVINTALNLCNEEKNKERESEKLKESIDKKYSWLQKYVEDSRYMGIRIEDIDISDPEVMENIKNEELEIIRNLRINL